MTIVPFVPSPKPVVRRMLELADIKPGDLVYDLGAGDGRIVIEAVKKYNAKGVAVEIRPDLIERINENVRKENVRDSVYVVRGDLYKVKLSKADIVTLYLTSDINAKLRFKLEKELKPGARVVAHDFPIPGWKPKEVLKVKYEGDVHKIFLYKMPIIKDLKKELEVSFNRIKRRI